MRPRDWFLVGIRLLGAWVFYRGVNEFTNFLSVVLDVVPQNYLDRDFGGSSWRATKNYLLYAAAYIAIALFFVFGGEGITKWVFDEYPRESDEEEDEAAS
jgi:hypothetical protein